MQLIETPQNPVPANGIVGAMRASDGVTLRFARWVPERSPAGTLVIASGRSEFIEKYFETISEALSRGLAVVAFDWRGQGLSDRELSNPHKGHIDDFSLYERDLDALVEQVLEPHCPGPWFALAHSMGAAILLDQARAGRSPFARMVMTAPMIELASGRAPPAARVLAVLLDSVGLGGAFVPGGRGRSLIARPFEGNWLTSDPARYARIQDIIAAEPRLAIGDPTIAWVHAAFRLMAKFRDAEYARRVSVPTLIVSGGADQIVDPASIERFASRLKAGRIIPIATARHEIVLESDPIRALFWSAFDAFIPGTAGEAEAILERYGRAS